MNKLLLRPIAFLLVPCLLADPVTAGGIQGALSRPTSIPLQDANGRLSEQALMAALVAGVFHLSFNPFSSAILQAQAAQAAQPESTPSIDVSEALGSLWSAFWNTAGNMGPGGWIIVSLLTFGLTVRALFPLFRGHMGRNPPHPFTIVSKALSLGMLTFVLSSFAWGSWVGPSSSLNDVQRVLENAIQEQRPVSSQEQQLIASRLDDPAIEDFVYQKLSGPVSRSYPDSVFDLGSILERRYNPSRIPELVAVMKIREMQLPDMIPRLIARSILEKWGISHPEETLRGIQAAGLIPPHENVLPASRGSKKKVAILILDSGDKDHDALVKRVGEARLRPGSQVSISLSGWSEAEKTVDQNPDTVFLVDVSFGDKLQDPLLIGGTWNEGWVKAMGKKGVIFVLAAGNAGIFTPWSHPPLDNVLYIAEADASGEQKYPQSNFGPPGYLYMAVPPLYLSGVDPRRLEGTSFSAPQVAVELGNLLEETPTLPEAEAITRLTAAAKPMDKDPLFKLGLLGKGLLPSLREIRPDVEQLVIQPPLSAPVPIPPAPPATIAKPAPPPPPAPSVPAKEASTPITKTLVGKTYISVGSPIRASRNGNNYTFGGLRASDDFDAVEVTVRNGRNRTAPYMRFEWVVGGNAVSVRAVANNPSGTSYTIFKNALTGNGTLRGVVEGSQNNLEANVMKYKEPAAGGAFILPFNLISLFWSVLAFFGWRPKARIRRSWVSLIASAA